MYSSASACHKGFLASLGVGALLGTFLVVVASLVTQAGSSDAAAPGFGISAPVFVAPVGIVAR